MKQGLISLVLVMLIFPYQAQADRNVEIIIDGKNVVTGDANAYIHESGRAMVPLRAVVDAILSEADVEWEGDKKQALVTFQERTVMFTAGEKMMELDGVEQSMDAEAVLKHHRLYVPVRSLAEALGFYIGYDPIHHSVHISTSFTRDDSLEIPGDNVFLVPDLDSVASTETFLPAGGTLLFSRPDQALYYYQLDESYQEGLNEKLFNTTKLLFHPQLYNRAIYDNETKQVSISLFPSVHDVEVGRPLIHLTVPEVSPLVVKGTENEANLKLEISRLNASESYAEGIYAMPDLETRLQDVLIYWMGEEIGLKAYQDVYRDYMNGHFYLSASIEETYTYEDGQQLYVTKKDEAWHVYLIKEREGQ